MARLQDKRSFRAINFDDADEYLEDGDVRSMLNVRVGYSESGNDGVITNVKGTVNKFSELSFSLPTGTNKCIGTCADDQNNRLIWFNYNSNGSHGIYCYNNGLDTIQTILASSTLNFSDSIIHSIDILDGNLAWVDNNRPRAINVAHAIAGDLNGATIEEIINDAKSVPMLPPVCTTTKTFGTDFIESLKSFQFIYRYVFIDGEKGAWSTVSKLVPTAYKDEHIEKITLDVSACELFTKTPLRDVVEFVEFASRELYTLNFNQFLRIETADLVTAAGIVEYDNTESKTPLDTELDTNIPYYENPIKAGTVCFQNDRKFYADCTEGYDAFGLSTINPNVQVIPSSGGIPYLSDCDTHVGERYLKPDSEYNYSVAWYDKYGRKSGAIDLPELVIKTQEQLSNDYKANVLQFGVNLTVPGSYPDWAEKFEILRSDNKSVTFFVQGRANRVLYCNGYDADGEPTYVNSGANATVQNTSDSGTIELHIDIENWAQYGTNIGYTFSEGDKLTFLTMGGVLDSNSVPVLKGMKIKEMRGSLLVVEYPAFGRINLNHAMLSNTTLEPFGFDVLIILSRFMVGDNGVALFSAWAEARPVGSPLPIASAPFTSIGKMTGFPVTTNNLHGVSLIYGNPVNCSLVDIYIVGQNGYFIKGSYQPIFQLFGSWTVVNTGTTSHINCIESSYTNHNKTDLIMVGDGGLILKYNIAGGTITTQTSGTTENLNHVYRNTTGNVLIAVGDNGTILRTTNNGTTWTQIETENCQNLNGIYFNGVYAVAVGDEGLLLRSTDSGATWIQRGISTVYNLNSVEGDGSDVDRVYIAGDSGYIGKFNMATGVSESAYNTGTTKNINFFQSFVAYPVFFFPGDAGISVGELDLLQDVYFLLNNFNNYSSNASSVYGSAFLNYRAKLEVYSPKTTAGPTIYYETGDAHLVGDSHTFNKGKESDGDVFLIKKDFRGTDWAMPGDLVFSMTPNSKDTTGPWDKDLGRPNVVLLYPEKQKRRNIIRFSEKHVQDSKINGLSNFQDVNYEPIPNEFGIVRKITPLESIMLINAERESATAYIDQTIFQGADGRDVAATSDRVINNVRKLAGGFGCKFPESLTSYLGMAYFLSDNKGAICRYNTSNGIFPISEYKARTYFDRVIKLLDSSSVANGGYEPKFRNYLLGISGENQDGSTNPDAITLSEIQGCTAEDRSPGTLDPIGNQIYWKSDDRIQVIDAESGDTIEIQTTNTSTPETPTYDSTNRRMYVSIDDDKVDVISTVSNTIISTIAVGTRPQTPIFDSVNNRMYVPNRSDDNVSVISTASNTVIATIAVGDRPVEGIFDLVNNRIYVVNVTGQTVSAISTASNTVIATISLSAAPVETSRVYITQGKIYITVANAVDVISTASNTVIETIATSIVAGQSIYTLINNTLYVSETTGTRVGYIDCSSNTLTGYITVASSPRGGTIDTTNELLIVSCNGEINFIDLTLNEVVQEITVDTLNTNDARYPVYVPDFKYIYFMADEASCGSSSGFSVASTGDYLTEATSWSEQTIAFQEGSNRWISKYSFSPERYGYVNTEMFSFLNGVLWKHNASNIYNNFHGTQYTSRVNPVFNKEPNSQKSFCSLSLEADKVWSASSITTPEGQETFILSAHFEQINKEWWADVKQDVNTPNMSSRDEALFNGDFMESNVLNVMLESQASDQAQLRFVNLYSNINQRTNR